MNFTNFEISPVIAVLGRDFSGEESKITVAKLEQKENRGKERSNINGRKILRRNFQFGNAAQNGSFGRKKSRREVSSYFSRNTKKKL